MAFRGRAVRVFLTQDIVMPGDVVVLVSHRDGPFALRRDPWLREWS